MKIQSYKKKKANIYEITLSNNEKISLYDDVILKYELLLKKELDNKLLEQIIKYNSHLESYFIALKYLKNKLRTEQEIRKKLVDFSNESIKYTIDRLNNEGYLNESLYIKSYINDEINLKIVGPNKILFDLRKLGFNEVEILTYLNTFANEIWMNKIEKYIKRKINSNHNLSGIVLKQKVTQDLLTKGFYKEHINVIINEYDFTDNLKIYEKEYQKLLKKFSKKYSGEELEYRIKIGLLKKGFKKNSD
ncbi:MAG: hypothetical protein E7161_00800 [Firmicutes bacterium]|nr:hypothetical protein [Bacillota bacterium]